MATQTTKYQDFIPKDLTFTKFEENERSKGQNIGYPRYKDDKSALLLQAPWIKLNAYGVPREGEYYKDAASRAFIKVPLDLSNPEIKEFFNKIKGIDTYMESAEFKKMQFGAKASKYKYVPIVRVPEEDEDEEEDDKKKKYPRPPYMKVKLDVTWPDTQVKTQVYTSIMKDGKREREQKEVETVDEFAAVVRYLSTIRPIIRPVKGWCEKKAKIGSDTMLYGVTFKLIKIEVEPAEGNNNPLLGSANAAFIDSDDEDSVKPLSKLSVSNNKTSVPLKINKKEEKEENSEGEEEDNTKGEEEEDNTEGEEEEEEEEEEPIPPPKKQPSSSKSKATAAAAKPKKK